MTDLEAQLLTDAESGRLRPLEEYQVQFPGQEADVASAYASVLQRAQGHTPMQPASRTTMGAEGLTRLERRDPEVIEEIARGGMGIVYAIRDDVLRRDLAMKKVTLVKIPEGATQGDTSSDVRELPNLLRRLMEEAQITAQLDHSGVVPVHELGIDSDGHLYFTMKRVRGRTLADVFEMVRGRGGTWSLSRALQVFIKICQTLAYAHGKGVIHRDLKPANVMVGRFGEVYVMDWGLAKVKGSTEAEDYQFVDEVISTDQSEMAEDDADHALTMHGDVLGTIGYMAPEQARGDRDGIDERTDIYAVGAMLYELLAGHAPYREPGSEQARPHEILLAMRKGPPPSLESLAPDAPPELVAITDKAMTFDADARFQTMQELSNELHAFLDGRVVQSYRTGVWIELRKWIQRNRLAFAGILAGVLLVIGTATAFVMQQRAAAVAIGRERDAAEAAARRATGLRLATRARLEAARDPSIALPIALAAQSRAPGRASLEALYVATDRSRLAAELKGHEGYVLHARFSPDGQYLVSFDGSGTGIVWDVERGEARHWLDSAEGETLAVALSNDGRYVASSHETGALQLFDLATGERAGVRRHGVDGRITQIAFETEGLGAVLAFEDGRVIRRAHLLEGEDELLSDHGPYQRPSKRQRPPRVIFSEAPHGCPVLCWYGADRRLMAYDLVAHKVLFEWPTTKRIATPRGGPAGLHLDAAARHLIAVWHDGTATWFYMATQAPHREFSDEGEPIRSARFSADGKRLFLDSQRARGEPRVRWYRTEDGSLGRSIEIGAGSSLKELDPTGGELLVVRNYDVEVWDAHSGIRRHELRGHLYRVREARFGPGGRWIATTSDDMFARIWHRRAPGAREGLVPWCRQGAKIKALDPSGTRAVLDEMPGRKPHELCIVDTMTGSILQVVDTDGQQVVLDYKGRAGVWHGVDTTGRVVRVDAAKDRVDVLGQLELVPDKLQFAYFSPDLRHVFSRANGEKPYMTWRVSDGVRVAHFGGVRTSAAAAWAKDSRRIVIAHSAYGVAGVYDALTGERLALMEGHGGYCLSAIWHPNDRWIATSAIDRTARIWDAETGEELHRVPGLDMTRQHLSFDAAGRELLTAGKNVRRWRIGEERVLEEIARLPGMRGLSKFPAAHASDGTSILYWHGSGRMRLVPMDPTPLARERNVYHVEPGNLRLGELGDVLTEQDIEARFAASQGPYFDALRVMRSTEAKEFDKADRLVRELIAQRPRWSRAHYLLARLRAAQAMERPEGDRTELRKQALASFERALDLGMRYSVRMSRMFEQDAQWDAWREDADLVALAARLEYR